jgi:hypothetical protein
MPIDFKFYDILRCTPRDLSGAPDLANHLRELLSAWYLPLKRLP